MSLPHFTPQMLHALAQPSSSSSATIQQQQQHQHQQAAPVLSSTAQAAAAISAYLSGAASIVFPSQQAAQDYQAAALAGAGGAGSGGGGREGLAWRQARAIEALLVQSGQVGTAGGWPTNHGGGGGWDQQQQQQQASFFGALQQPSQLYTATQPAYGLLMQHPLLQPYQPPQPFAFNPSPLASQAPVAAGPSSNGTQSLLSDASPAFSAQSPPMSTHSSFSSGDSSASSPLLSVASVSSASAPGHQQPAIYSASTSTVDPFELGAPGTGAVGEGMGFKEIFGFSPAVAFGNSFANGGPVQSQPAYNDAAPAQPYHFNALPSDGTTSYTPSPRSSISSSSAAPTGTTSTSKQPSQAELAAAAAAHFAWNQSVNLRDPKKRHVCPVCARGFARAFNLKSHMATHDQNRPKPFTCPHEGCARGFSRSHDLERHRVGIHQDVGDDLGLAMSTPLPSSGASSSGSSTASNSTTAARDSKLAGHNGASKAKKRAVRGVDSSAY